MKTCAHCDVTKPFAEFYKAAARQDGLHSSCKACVNVSYKGSRDKKLNHYNRVKRTRVNGISMQMRKWKEERGCMFCREDFGPALCLHHLDPSQKDIQPADAAGYSWQKFLTEAAKCVVVCSVCHTKVHHGLLVVDINANK